VELVLVDPDGGHRLARRADRGAGSGPEHGREEQRPEQQAPERAPAGAAPLVLVPVARRRLGRTLGPRHDRGVDDPHRVLRRGVVQDPGRGVRALGRVEPPDGERGHRALLPAQPSSLALAAANSASVSTPEAWSWPRRSSWPSRSSWAAGAAGAAAACWAAACWAAACWAAASMRACSCAACACWASHDCCALAFCRRETAPAVAWAVPAITAVRAAVPMRP